MEVEVTKNFAKQFNKLDSGMQNAVERAFEKLAENPQSVKFEEKLGSAKGIFTMRLDGNYRVAFTKNVDGNFVPAFVGNHKNYDRFLADSANLKPERLLGADNSRVKTMDMDIPDSLTKEGVLGKTSFSIGNIKLRGVVGAVISGGTILALGGTAEEAAAATTPGHVGFELAEGDIKGATQALVVDGAGDVGCLAGLAAGAKGGAAVGAWAKLVGAVPGAIIGGAGGCIVGGIAASETVQAAWNYLFKGEENVSSDPKAVLERLKDIGIELVPDETSDTMPPDVRELVTYKQVVSQALDTLNRTAAELSKNPENVAAQEAFIDANSQFVQAAEAYQYSASSPEDPGAVEEYLRSASADKVSVLDSGGGYEKTYAGNDKEGIGTHASP